VPPSGRALWIWQLLDGRCGAAFLPNGAVLTRSQPGPSPSGILPCRLHRHRGASAVAAAIAVNRIEDSMKFRPRHRPDREHRGMRHTVDRLRVKPDTARPMMPHPPRTILRCANYTRKSTSRDRPATGPDPV
jgi:hypothetical protein